MSGPVPTSVAAALAGAQALAEVDWDQADRGELPGLAVELARTRTLVEAALVEVAGQLQAADAAADAGWASTKDFLTHVTGGHKGAGGGLVRLAERVREMPDLRRALASGAVSTSQARVIATRVNTLPRDDDFRAAVVAGLLDRATSQQLDASDLDRAFVPLVRELDPDGVVVGRDLDRRPGERGAHHARFLSFTPDTLGGVRVRGYGSVEDVERIQASLMSLAAPQTTERGACGGDPDRIGRRDAEGRLVGTGCPTPGCAHDGKDPRDAGVRLWDGLVETCGRLQATDSLPHAHGSSTRVVVTLSYESLRDALGGHPVVDGVLASGGSLSAAAVRRLACDAEIIPGVLGADGQILDVGRAQRLVTAAIWLALVLRDGHCAFPGCTRLPIACDAHHIVHWADGGPTSLDNLVLLCRRHHMVTHHTPWQVRIDDRTRRPVWIPPPRVDDRGRFTLYPGTSPPSPLVA